ncbi:hypothetical protein AADZ90_006850 [Aestuariibius sp. 2305UL40-4]|uniref:hypothetical protein n=1 Tax=Aestuariibius violaceus TaxID=3234132 RepID=UPI00345F05B9
MTFHKSIALSVLALATACAPAGPTMTTSATFQGGDRPISAVSAARLFQSVCVANRNNLSAIPAALAQSTFILNTSENVYYHVDYDLSFALVASSPNPICSFVWASPEPVSVNQAALASVAPGGQFRDVREISKFNYSIRGLP